MTNVYVGFHDQRNSSRVLKPPGGGTSNIFNNDVTDDVNKSSPIRDGGAKYKTSTIQDVLQTNKEEEIQKKEENDVEVEEMKIIVEETSKSSTETVNNVIKCDSSSVAEQQSFKKAASIGDILNQDDILEKKKVKSPSGNQRVPPGGYSSGLW